VMLTERELETRLRRDAVAVRLAAEPDAAFHARIMTKAQATVASPISPTRSLRVPGQLAFAAGLVLVALALGFAFSRLNALRPAQQNQGAPALAGMMIAADPVRHQVVVFGGGSPDPSQAKSDTWTWDGSTWTLRHPPTSPPARSEFSMAYDAAHDAIVIFGGMTAAPGPAPPSNLNDTWVWNGATWKQAHPNVVPPPTNYSAMAYDPSLGLTVLLDGGFTWTFDGLEWTKGIPTPPGKGADPMAYDPASGTLVLLSLSAANTATLQLATWHFDGKAWTEQPSTGLPVNWSPALIAQDPLSGSLMGVDGQGRTWAWDGRSWTVLNVKTIAAYGGAAITYDSTRHLVLVFGGQGANGQAVSDLWAWDGTQWTQLQGGQQLPTPPPAPAAEGPALSLGVSGPTGDWIIRRPSRQNGPDNGLYQSTDGGRSWQRRLEFNGIYDGMSWAPSGGGVIWSIDMAAHACPTAAANCSPPSQSLTVYATSDGGLHWSPRAPTSWAAEFVFFRGTEGWATSGGPGSGSNAPNLYRTADAGASWTVVGAAPIGNVGHTYGVGETPLVFATSQTGWFATRQAGNPNNSGLVITTNGGRTWASQPVQPPTGVTQPELMLGYPKILADGTLLLPAFVGRQTDPNTFSISRWYVYFSSDGGLTWSNPQVVQAANGVKPTGDEFQDSFVDALHWWFTAVDQRSAGEPVAQASPAVGRTMDGGKTWEVFKSPTIIQLEFSDASRGWAFAVSGPNNTNVLLRTTDGGAHWNQVRIP